MTSTQKSSTSVQPKAGVPPIVLLLLSLGLIAGFSWLRSHLFSHTSQSLNSGALEDRMSLGEQLLIEAEATPEKRAGVAAFAKGDFEGAVTQFEASRQKHQNDPETLIYWNNARVGNSALRIAVSVPIGSNLNVAQEMLRGVAQAQDEVNQQGGLRGKLLQVAIADDENQPEIARQFATALVNDAQTLAVVGHNASDASVAAAPIYDQGELVMLSPTSFSDKLSSSGNYIFRMVPNIRFIADALARYAIKTDYKAKIAICSDAAAV